MADDYRAFLAAEAQRQGISPALAQYVGHTESRFNPLAVSHAGARGIMQLMPATGAALGLRSPADFFDPYKNMQAGVANLAQLSRQFHGDPTAMLIGYNAGPRWAHDYLSGRVSFAQLPHETQAYVQGYVPGAIRTGPIQIASSQAASPVGQNNDPNPFVPAAFHSGSFRPAAPPTYGSAVFAPQYSDAGSFGRNERRPEDTRPDYFASTGIG